MKIGYDLSSLPQWVSGISLFGTNVHRTDCMVTLWISAFQLTTMLVIFTA